MAATVISMTDSNDEARATVNAPQLDVKYLGKLEVFVGDEGKWKLWKLKFTNWMAILDEKY